MPVSILLSLFLLLKIYFLIDPLLSLVGLNANTGGATYEAAKTYIFIIFLGTICQVAYNQICSLLRSIGDSITPLLFLIASTILNIFLDLLFIVVFHWKLYWKHLKLGLPLALQFSILAIGLITLQSTIIKFDTTLAGEVIDNGPAQLAYGAANKVQTFLMTPLNALGTAMLSFCGQNFGAKLYKRVKKGISTAIIMMLIMYVFLLSIALLLLIDDAYLKIFYAAENISEKTSYLGRLNILFTVPFFPLLGTLFILRCSIQGVEKPIIPFLAGIGELLAKGPSIMLGYYNNDEANKETLEDGWLHTGDLAKIDKDGFIFISGRKKFVIVQKNGKNIYPEELEILINKIEGVKESFVYGKPEDDGDFKIAAKIVYDKENSKEIFGTIDEEKIKEKIWKEIKKVNKTMPAYKYVRDIIVTDKELIKTTTQKVKRAEEIKTVL